MRPRRSGRSAAKLLLKFAASAANVQKKQLHYYKYLHRHAHTHIHACMCHNSRGNFKSGFKWPLVTVQPFSSSSLDPDSANTLCARSWHRKKVKCCNIGSTNQLPSATMCASKSAFCSAKNAPTPRKPARTSTTSTRGNANYADPNLCQPRIAQLSYTCRKTVVCSPVNQFVRLSKLQQLSTPINF